MNKIGIVYSMRNEKRLAETYIELPVRKETEKHLIDNDKHNFSYEKFYDEMKLKEALRAICELQGYILEEIITIETV